MEALRHPLAIAFRACCACVGLLLLPLLPAFAQEASPTLFGQAAAALLDHDFPSHRVEYLLLDPRTGQMIALRWSHPEHPIPPGSLLKPFVAMAYMQMHSSVNAVSPAQFPVVYCHGRSDGCWNTSGHGSLGLENALAKSCNAYFLRLAADLAAPDRGAEALEKMSASYGLPAPPQRATPRTLIGVTPEWRISPLALAHAYAALAAQSNSEGAGRLLTGMRLAAEPGGTAALAGSHPGGVLAKTGTAPCVADPESNSPRCAANGDGLAVVLTPAENPRLLLLVRERGTPGAQAARLAGQMLLKLEEAHAATR